MIFEINTTLYEKLDRSFYERQDVTEVAKDLLGKYLFSNFMGVITAGRIVETEAYSGRNDKACHAYKKRTSRTEVMYGPGGHAYVYLCYGIHHLFNVVTNKQGLADAVLIRALEPEIGLEQMMERRGKNVKRLASGPGILSQAMGIKTNLTGSDLTGNQLWIGKCEEPSFDIIEDVRIGIDYAEEDALKPWRYIIKGNSYISVNKKTRVD